MERLIDLGGSTGSRWTLGIGGMFIILALVIDGLSAFLGLRFNLQPATLIMTGSALILSHQARRGLESRNGTHKRPDGQ